MSLPTKRQMEKSIHNGFGIFGVILMAITAAIIFGGTVTVSDAMVVHPVKAPFSVLKASPSSSPLHQSSMSRQQHRLHKRETSDDTNNGPIEEGDDDSQYDENYEVVPVFSGETPKTMGEHLSEKAKEVAESFSQMWESVAESFKRCVASIRQLFDADDDEEIFLTPEEAEARGKAIEEYNQLYRHASENQI